MAEQIHWNCQTNPLKLLNEINGIVGRIQWIRLQKLAVLLAETGRLTTQKQQKTWAKTLVCLRRHMNMHE